MIAEGELTLTTRGTFAYFLAGALVLDGCARDPRATRPRPPEADATPPAVAAVPEPTPSSSPAGAHATLDSGHPVFERESIDALRDLVPLAPLPDGGRALLQLWHFRYGPGRWNQGKKMSVPLEGTTARPQHAIARDACLSALSTIQLQTEEQRTRCKGERNMVPIYPGGNPENAKACIDIFEFPNLPCELPFVWGTPADAAQVCGAQGKRLCTQDEWTLACAGDPRGGRDFLYAYGDELDLTRCNTNKPHPVRPSTNQWVCSVRDENAAWETCASETEPSGAFPQCRSRFGVYDQHGNVAEMMTRSEAGTVYTQLKGSAFFYVDVARAHNEPPKRDALRETYPDHCRFDPRWHVEVLATSGHSNYHLGFRCCKSL